MVDVARKITTHRVTHQRLIGLAELSLGHYKPTLPT
jgi:hypothetical protein